MVAAVLGQVVSLCASLGGQAAAREAWAARHDEPAQASEEGASLAIDLAGDIYIAGGYRRTEDEDSFTATIERRDPEGKLLWSRRLDLFASPPSLHLDPGGSIVLAGVEGVLKLDRDGRQLWAFPESLEPGYRCHVTIDAQGNIVRAGAIPPQWGEVTLARLDPLGNLLWRRAHASPSGAFELAAMAADPGGNVVITGKSDDGACIAYLTAKLDRDGALLWEALFSGFCRGHRATSLAVDGAGNAFVGGSTALLKYDPAGHEVWRRPFGQIEQVRVHQSGDLFAQSFAFIARLDPDGNVRWRHDRGDGFVASVIARDGGLYASTGDGSVVKLGPEGQSSWERAMVGLGGSPHFPTLALDPAGNLLMSGLAQTVPGQPDRWTLKYSPAGQELWRIRQDEPGNGDEAAHAAIQDREGNLFVLADTFIGGSSNDFLTVKFSPDGRKLWSVRHTSPRQEIVGAIAIGPDGHPVVSGKSEDDLLTLKYDARSGRLLWEAREASPRQVRFASAGMTVDAAGNVWVSGGQAGFASSNTTVKYDTDGSRLWVLRHGIEERATRIAADTWGDAYLILIGDRASSLAKISADGSVLWEVEHWVPAPWELALDGEGYVYLAGTVKPQGKESDFLLLKYDPLTGQKVWEAWYDGPAGVSGIPVSLVVDREGNSYLSGPSEGMGQFPEHAVVKHDRNGTRMWEARMPSVGRIDSGGPRLALDRAGGLVVSCYADARPADSFSGERRLEVFRLSQAGQLLWKADRPGPRARGHRIPAVPVPVIDASGTVFIAGSRYTPETDNDLEVLKYSTAPVPFVRGDCDGDGKASGSVTDAVVLLLHLFAGGPAPRCPAACDAGGDGRLSLADPVSLILFNFLGGPPPPLPFPACGHDTETPLACEDYRGC